MRDFSDMPHEMRTGRWRVHLVWPGERYGRADSLTYGVDDSYGARHGNKTAADLYNESYPLVEFYDMANSESHPNGEFVSRYYATTLLGVDGSAHPVSLWDRTSLPLEGLIPEWTVTGDDLRATADFVQNEFELVGGESPEPQKPEPLRGLLIATDELPREVEVAVDGEGSTLRALQGLVGGLIQPFDVIFGDGISLYVNEEGIGTCPPNRAVYATRGMEREGYLSQMDYATPVREGDLYGLLFGDIVALGYDAMEGTSRSLTDEEVARVSEYFTSESGPGSGLAEVVAVRYDNRAGDLGRESRPEPIRMAVLAGYDLASESRDMTAASEELDASGHGIDAPERDDDR